jgi:hypothetical protein
MADSSYLSLDLRRNVGRRPTHLVGLLTNFAVSQEKPNGRQAACLTVYRLRWICDTIGDWSSNSLIRIFCEWFADNWLFLEDALGFDGGAGRDGGNCVYNPDDFDSFAVKLSDFCHGIRWCDKF